MSGNVFIVGKLKDPNIDVPAISKEQLEECKKVVEKYPQKHDTEIERKFRINYFPDLPLIEQAEVYQAYLCFDPEIRIRLLEFPDFTHCYLTIKSDGTLEREEIEMPISKAQFYSLARLVNNRYAIKDYRAFRLPTGEKLECSNVDNHKLFYAEVEFKTLGEAKAFQPLPFMVEEITYDAKYKMKNYYRNKFGI